MAGHRRFGLRARLTLIFGIGALALSSALGTIAYLTTRSSIVGQQVSSVEQIAASNAAQLARSVVAAPQFGIQAISTLASIDVASSQAASSSSFSFLYVHRNGSRPIWYVDSQQVHESNLPTSLKDLVLSGTPAQQTFSHDGATLIGVGIPIPSPNATIAYFEVFVPATISRTLHLLLASLMLAAIATTLVGAIVGRWAATRALRPLRDASRAALAIAAGNLDTRISTREVSDLAVLAASFNRMVDRLAERIARDARFTSDVSHELRSPLTTLAAALSVVEARRDDLPERSKQALDLLSAEIRRFQRMLDVLLEISRLDSGPVEFDPTLVKVGELLPQALRATIDGPAIPISYAPGTQELYLRVEKRRFERMIGNLVENARRYAGGVDAVTVRRRGGDLLIAVEDHGPGVPSNEREHIFERFARGSTAAGSRGLSDGTGLGLALVAEHAKLHGGEIWVEDNESVGARFVIRLPLANDPSEPQEGAAEELVDENLIDAIETK